MRQNKYCTDLLASSFRHSVWRVGAICFTFDLLCADYSKCQYVTKTQIKKSELPHSLIMQLWMQIRGPFECFLLLSLPLEYSRKQKQFWATCCFLCPIVSYAWMTCRYAWCIVSFLHDLGNLILLRYRCFCETTNIRQQSMSVDQTQFH